MRHYFQRILDSFRKGDKILLALCMITTIFGCVIIASTNNFRDPTRYVVMQLAGAAIGIFLYILVSTLDLDFILEYRFPLVLFNCFLLLLLIPFGVDYDSGNKSWLHFPFLPMDIQVAEICKITFIIIMASVMAAHQNRISNYRSVFHMVFHLGLLAVLNVVVSRDIGVTLIFVAIFAGMAFAGGVDLKWFALAIGGGSLVLALLWKLDKLPAHIVNRILVLVDPSLDPTATGIRWHTNRSLLSLTGGGLSGQGLFNGTRTQVGALTAQHTDYIFSAIGEELGFFGCLAVMVMEFAIIARIVYVGTHTPDFARRVVCFGAASALIFQVFANIGMCIGMLPVIGLTLPFISYGSSSLVSLYGMLGLVSGIYARPVPGEQGVYIQPPR